MINIDILLSVSGPAEALYVLSHKNKEQKVSREQDREADNFFAACINSLLEDDMEVNSREMVLKYLKLKFEIQYISLDFWKQNSDTYPKLAMVLAIPAASTQSERNFSTAGRTI